MTTLDLEPSGLAVLTIDAGPLNLYTPELHEDLDAALDRLPADTRALLIRADGKIVSGGVDVGQFAAQESPEQAKVLFDRMLTLPDRIAALEFPTVFAAHALCLTWAFELAVACDIILAAERASFGLVEKVVGLTPTMGGTQRLAARAGVGRAKEFVMTGERYPAATLERWNVVNRVLPDEGFDDAARAFAASLAEGPTRAHAATKRVLDHFQHGGVPEANAHITTIAADLYRTEDLRSAVRSFLAEGPGKATFTGR
ncbi:enoyl-CoA hydratase/isomerase family protein [Amycolatopsis acidiphila]|uniref:Enoyl-CoA hydratase/isomerase family protein n=1 Tax=Amycolatopsis acidiphila TaxID=715473 RepID=A0A557ZYJ5_9PSEU|nr:enoyl-CoA hydratase/isomerase family protein [Amycolatopsis acidiphila]TVT17095.1 enoyl-CoA hydratase/isomerase family protein [Amycolatopsis acidiphila]UIJ61961.1 enoyl-CoA hydratase/isomerase family protein [Amycolatopsis acidiphila]GHG56889.1 enoyl-CoA hydratase [Amycolatopsis acidiphila]